MFTMKSDRYEPFPILIESFFQTVENYFHFLVSAYNYTESKRLIDYGSEYCVFDEGKFPKNTWIFMAKKEYSLNKSGFIITYGDRESNIELKYYQNSYNQTFSVWEIFEANKLNHTAIGGQQFVLNSAFMNETISLMANELKTNINLIIPVKRSTINTISRNRVNILKQWKLNQEQHEIDQAINKAAISFQNQDFNEVVKILNDYKTKLPYSQKLKLKIAKSKC